MCLNYSLRYRQAKPGSPDVRRLLRMPEPIEYKVQFVRWDPNTGVGHRHHDFLVRG
jgi:hypothetical protein